MSKKILFLSMAIIIASSILITDVKAGVGTAPDLAVTSIGAYKSLLFDPFPQIDITYQVNMGDSVLVKANIKNIGTANSNDMTIKTYIINSLSSEEKMIASQNYSLADGSGGSVPPGSSIDYKYNIDASNFIEGKNSIIIKVIDNTVQNSSIDVYSESNLDNNQASLSIAVYKPSIAQPPSENCEVYTYQDKYYGGNQMCIDNIWVKGVYFIAKDQTSSFQSYWSESILNVLGQIKSFYENQFDNKIKITIDNTPIVIYGEKDIGDYNYSSIAQEVYNKVSVNFPIGNYFIDIQTYVVDGANGVNGNNLYTGSIFINNKVGSINQSGWLNPESLGTVTTKYGTDYSGYLGSAHEFGHSLGIPHPWEEELNKDSKGNIINPTYGNDEIGSIMSYNGLKGPLIPNSFIRTQVKQKMMVQSSIQPSITNVTGPSSLRVGEMGTWQITINYPVSTMEKLSFYTTWGDEQTPLIPPSYIGPNTASGADDGAKFNHVFNSNGIYNLTFTIVNPANQSAKANFVVKVSVNENFLPDTQIGQITTNANLLSNDKMADILAELQVLRDTVKEQQTQIKYLNSLVKDVSALSQKTQDALNNFITYGVDSNTQKLGAGERAAVINSYKAAFDKLPQTEAELADVIKIANGRWPSITNQDAENQAKAQFLKIYKRTADMNDANDNAAVTVMAYGLRQKAENRNLNSEKAGIKIFKAIYGHTPNSTEDWNIMQAITYSGASR